MALASRNVLFLTGGVLVLTAGVLAGWNLDRMFYERPGPAPTLAANPAEARVLAAIAKLRDAGDRRLAVPDSDGQTLRILAEAIDARNVVEIGTSTGYSALWLGLAMRQTGGKLTTFEINPAPAAKARKYISEAGLDEYVNIVVGDAHKRISELSGPIDLVFIDADKEGYADYLEKLLPMVRPGGLILAHNVEMAPEFMARVKRDARLDTVLLSDSGLSVTLKKRPEGGGPAELRLPRLFGQQQGAELPRAAVFGKEPRNLADRTARAVRFGCEIEPVERLRQDVDERVL